MALRPPFNENDHVHGESDAPIELVEYGDYQCPHCGRAHPIVKKLQQTLGNQLRFVFRNFPLAELHPEAVITAIATEAAALQGKYWEMHDRAFENQDDLGEESLYAWAEELGLDMEKFHADMQSEALQTKVDNDFESGIRSGVNATPTFFINGEKYNNGWESDRILTWLREQNIAR